jgi:outer membrane receptor protein involved in Fe transport
MQIRVALISATSFLLTNVPSAVAQDQQQAQPAEDAQSGETAPAPPPAEPANAITVTGQRSALRTSIDRLSYDVANDLQTSTGSVADALRNVPGVEVDAQGNVSLRGDGNVTILIDGRPSGAFSGEGRADALQQFPADQLTRVEVITNPNAALSPEGTAGVINLVTKRDRKPGAFGTLRANVGTEDRWSLGLSGSRVGQKLTLSGDVGFRAAGSGDNESLRARAVLDPTTNTFLEQRTEGVSKTTGGGFRSARGSVDYDLNARDRLSGEVSHRGFVFEGEGRETFEADAPPEGFAGASERLTTSEFARLGSEARASFRRRFGDDTSAYNAEDHEFLINLGLEHDENRNDDDELFLDENEQTARRSNSEVLSDEIELKIEYARPLPDAAKMRIGAETELEMNDYDNRVATGDSFDALTVDRALTNQFAYDESVYAVYGTYERPFGKITVQGGLRLEQIEIEIDQKTSDVQRSNDYFRAYPTVFATYDFDDSRRARVSYSRRIRRPDAQDVNPFIVYEDPQNFRQGNPDLEPEITDSAELGYQHRRGQAFYLATLFYRQSSDGITDVVRELGDGVFLTTRENLSESRRAGLELVANGRLSKSLTYNASATALWNEIDAQTSAFAGSRSGTSLGGRFSLNWQPTQNDFLQASGFVIGEQLQAQGVREPTGAVNLGYRRKLNERVSFVFTANNVLDSFSQTTVIDTPTLRERTERNWFTPSAFIGLTFNLGDTAANASRRREPGFEFEGGGGPG